MSTVRKILKVRLPPLPSIKDVVKLYKLRAMKQLSQNFLMDERLTDKIVRSAGYIEGHHVCEVGPGPGSITRSIIRQSPSQLVVVEKDPRFIPTLEMLAEAVQGYMDLNIVVGDILKTNLERIFPDAPKVPWNEKPPPVHLIGNLPFSVSTILIIRWLEDISLKRNAWTFGRTKMTLTFQKEVAERMVAPILSSQRCRLSLMCQNWCKVEHRFNISGKSFVPKPDVDVGVVTFTPLKEPHIPLDFKLVEKVLRQIFHMRQKYSIRGAQTLFPEESREFLAMKMYKMAGINPETRPFQITMEEFKYICYAYKKIIEEYPEVADYDYRAPKIKKTIASTDVVQEVDDDYFDDLEENTNENNSSDDNVK